MNHVFQVLYYPTILITLLYSQVVSLPSVSLLNLSSGQTGESGERLERKVWREWNQTKRKPGDVSTSKTVLETSYGLHSLSFERREGRIIVNLPDDVTAGDSISGTIIVKPAGETQDQQTTNLDRLNMYEIEVERQKTRLHERWARWNVPAKSTSLSIILRNQNGQELAKHRISVSPYSAPVASERPTLYGVQSANRFQPPAVGQAGRPIEILGWFDGDLHNTAIRLQGQPVRILGESPRKAIAYNPRNNIGKTAIEIVEGDVSLTCHYRNIGLSLSAPKLALDHGEETTLTVLVEGLQDLEQPVPVELENRSPIVVGLNGGNKQTISLRPEEVINGAIKATRKLTGIGPGDFNIVVGVGQFGSLGECSAH